MKSESWFKRADALLAAFFIPVAIMILIFVQRQIFPFGDNSFLRTDMYHQYAPFCEPTQLVDRALSKVFSYRVYDLYDCG